jgi:hypothetical protein
VRIATNVVLAVVALTSSAAAERVSFATAEVMRALDHNEVLLGTRLALYSIDVEVARVDFVDFSGGSSFDLRGGFLGWAYRIERPHWGAFVGAHGFTLWNDAIRYLTPWAGIRAGEETRMSIEVRSAGLFAKELDGATKRSFVRDFDIAARVSTPASFARVEARARYRDIDTGSLHVRDVFLAAGVELSIRRGPHRALPTFVGIGWRHDTRRDEAITGDLSERMVGARGRPSWQALLWLEVDFGLHSPERK